MPNTDLSITFTATNFRIKCWWLIFLSFSCGKWGVWYTKFLVCFSSMSRGQQQCQLVSRCNFSCCQQSDLISKRQNICLFDFCYSKTNFVLVNTLTLLASIDFTAGTVLGRSLCCQSFAARLQCGNASRVFSLDDSTVSVVIHRVVKKDRAESEAERKQV